MEDLDYEKLQRRYGGQYVVVRGREVLVNSASFDEIADWLDANGPLFKAVRVAYVARPDVFAIY